MRLSRRFLVGFFAILALAALVIWRASRPMPMDASRPAPVAAAPAPVMNPAAAVSLPVALPTAPSDETVATARMYAAHAPLRVPEIANPDSVTNKQILQTMVAKALAKKQGTASATNP
jgi:hypothetical protein